MSSGRVIEPELNALKKAAERLALRARETPSTVHLLAAIAEGGTPASELFSARGLSREALLRLGHAQKDHVSDPLRAALSRAHAIAVRMGLTQATSAHLLVALLSEARSAARQVIEQSGVDVGRLRTAALQVGLGTRRTRRAAPPLPSARNAQSLENAPETRARPSRAARTVRASSPAVSVPLIRTPPMALANATPVPVAPVAPAQAVRVAPPAAPAPSQAPRSARFELDAQRFPTLAGLGRNLTLLAAKGELDPVVVRDAVIERALDVLAKREGNNPCLIGSAGVGKTSVVRGLAERIAHAKGVESLDDKIIIEIPVSELIAGTGVRGALAQRLSAIRKEVLAARGRVVIFFDEIHQLFTGDAADEISGELKLALARGELPCIGATTHEEYQRAIGSDAALARRFSIVEVEEPSREEAYLVLEALKPRLEAHHHAHYQTDALALSVAWSVRYLPGRALPDKAISILDLAGARTRRRGGAEIGAEIVAEVVAELADMPVERLLESDSDRFLRLEAILAERVVGHAEPIRKIARILRRNAAGLGTRRPIGTFLLLGPSGVGKTETAKAIAEVLFHNEAAMTRIDLSEYGEAHAVARLIGAPPGYVGHESGGQLTEAVRRRPYQVILLDELEKAHPDVLMAFLGVFDEGRLTDGRGRTVDFTNSVILMTSNLGSSVASQRRSRRVGFGESGEGAENDFAARIVEAARGALAPELYNRIDEVLVYEPLTRTDVREIARRLLAGLSRTLHATRGIRVQFGAELIEHLLDHGGFEPALGARPMKRCIARLIEAPIAEKILEGELGRGSVVMLDVEGGEVVFDVLDGTTSAAE